jgi:hypothetical protein
VDQPESLLEHSSSDQLYFSQEFLSMTELEEVNRLIIFFTDKIAVFTQQLADASVEEAARLQALVDQAVADRDWQIRKLTAIQDKCDRDVD